MVFVCFCKALMESFLQISRNFSLWKISVPPGSMGSKLQLTQCDRTFFGSTDMQELCCRQKPKKIKRAAKAAFSYDNLKDGLWVLTFVHQNVLNVSKVLTTLFA